jgi:prolyl oligopeptidase PreP (S9A serine peptidase family)
MVRIRNGDTKCYEGHLLCVHHYTRPHINTTKGFKEFGRAMQGDVADAAQWLVDEGLVDTDALIAMGTSYGGYSAALVMMRDPGLFDAAIVEFPMLDVEFQHKHHPGF